MERKWPVSTSDEDAEWFVKEADLTEYDFSQIVPVRYEFGEGAATLNSKGEPSPIRCWACQNKLTSRQKFCNECKHWQDWRHYTGFSATILSLIIALFPVAGLTTPLIKNAFSEPQIILDARVERDDICLASPEHCEREDAQLYTRFSFWFTNLSGFDVLLSDWMECNSLSGDLIDTEDEYGSPTFRAKQRTLLRQPDAAYEDQEKIHYVIQTYQADAPTRLPYVRALGCVIEIKSAPGKYFFISIYDEEFMSGEVVDLGRSFGRQSIELFEHLREMKWNWLGRSEQGR